MKSTVFPKMNAFYKYKPYPTGKSFRLVLRRALILSLGCVSQNLHKIIYFEISVL